MSTRSWLDNGGRFRFGKHVGETVYDVALRDYGYLLWILEDVDDCDEEDRELIHTLVKQYKNRR